MMMVLGDATVRSDRFDEALALAHEHVARSRAEPGCLAHAVHRDTENPLRLVFVERWESMGALQDHFAVPASRAFGKALVALCDAAPDIALFDATPVPMPGRRSA